MNRLKARWLYAGLLALVALSWPFAPQIIAQTKFSWNSLEWDTYVEGHSIVYEKVGGDTAYFNVYENAAPGVEVGDNEPGTCDATSGFRGVLWYDTAGADSGLKWCNDEDGSYNWDAIALDADRDGFSNSIDGDDATAATGYDDPVAYQVTTTYTGADVQYTHTNGNAYYARVATSGGINHPSAVAQHICETHGDLTFTSFTTSQVSPTFTGTNIADRNLDASADIEDYFNLLENENDRTMSLSQFSTANQTGLSGVTCVDTRDT